MMPRAVTSLRTFFFVFVLSYGTSATSILDNVSEPSLASPGEMASQSNTRSLRTIIWTCLFAISIAAWISAGPNIPPRPPNERRWLYTKITTTIIIILAPEFVGVWYTKQWFAAREISGRIRAEFPSAEWSHSHGFLVAMGGFTLVSPDGQLEVLSDERFYELLRSSQINLPAITSEDIRDISKSDVLVRLTAVGHMTWFILPCVARQSGGLTITHLELLTLALTSISSLLYTVTWLKPICVQESVKVYLKSSTTTVTSWDDPHPSSDNHFISLADKVFEYLKLKSLIHLLRNTWRVRPVFTILLLPTCLPLFLFFLFACFLFAIISIIGPAAKPQPVSKARNQFFILLRTYLPFPFRYIIRWCLRWILSHDSPFIHLLGWFVFLPTLLVILLPIQLCVFLFVAILFLVYIVVACISSMLEPNVIQPGATCVPVFYAPEIPANRHIKVIIFPVFGLMFGGVHCSGWNLKYPTRAEQILWRVTSLFITCSPSVISCIHTRRDPGRRRAVHMVEILLLFLYASARLSLLVQALVLLRELPPSTYRDVDWSQFFPHV